VRSRFNLSRRLSFPERFPSGDRNLDLDLDLDLDLNLNRRAAAPAGPYRVVPGVSPPAPAPGTRRGDTART